MQLPAHRRIDIAGPRPRSLAWDEDALIDVAAGGARYRLDGRFQDGPFSMAFEFDSALCLAGTDWTVAYARLGTKAALFHRDRLVRELNRSFYFADHYDYPIALFGRRDGRVAIAHCPDGYCVLELEDALTGERLSTRTSRAPDYFHSRLAVSPDGRYLVSAGWIWQPVEIFEVFDLHEAERNPCELDRSRFSFEGDRDVETAQVEFDGPNRLLVAGIAGGGASSRVVLETVELPSRIVRAVAPLEELPGPMMRVGDWLFGVEGTPKLFELGSGRVVQRWSDLPTGRFGGCIDLSKTARVPVAIDPPRRRAAIATDAGVTVLSW